MIILKEVKMNFTLTLDFFESFLILLFGSKGGSSTPAPTPPPPPEPPQPTDENVRGQMEAAMPKHGREKTIATSPLGIEEEAETSKSILGV